MVGSLVLSVVTARYNDCGMFLSIMRTFIKLSILYISSQTENQEWYLFDVELLMYESKTV